jgi:hypothetical protein
MQGLASRILFLILMLGFSSRMFGHVALDYPVGGETYIQGQAVTIQWHIVAFHMQLNWDLYFSSDGGDTWEPIQLDIPVDTLHYTWIVPAVVTSQGRIKIFQDNVEHDYLDVSGDFNIVPNTSPPSLDAPANDTIIECHAGNQEAFIQSWLNDHGGAAATHYCGDLLWTHDYDGLSDDCGSTGSALVTFTATDDCGSTFTVATVTVVDTHPPTISIFPSDKVVECDGHGNQSEIHSWLSNHGGAQAIDACSEVIWTNNYSSVSNGCGATGSAQVIFKAADACGNYSTAVATLTIADNVAPLLLQVAHDTLLECGPSNVEAIQFWLDHHGGAQAKDSCGNVSWTNNFSALSDGCGNTGSALVIFTATDECGNSTTTAASILIQDHTAPAVTVVAKDTILFCGAPNLTDEIQSWLIRHGGAQANDACGKVNWSNDYSGSIDSCSTDSTLVTFMTSDDCGNNATTQARLITLDTTTHIADTTIFAPIGATWYYNPASNGPPWLSNPLHSYFVVEKDTVIQGFVAREIGCFVNHQNNLERVDSLTQYVATVGAKVFYKVVDEFVLLYDFGAQVGDTIHSKVESSELSLGCLSVFDEDVLSFSYVIDSLGTTIIDGELLRLQYVHTIDMPSGDNWGWIFEPIIERLGYKGVGGFWWGQGLGCIFEGGFLRCYQDAEISWRSPLFDGSLACDYVTSSVEIPDSYYSIHPNPSTGMIYLPYEANSISVFSLEGKEANYSQSENEIDLSGNPVGLYIVRFEIGKQTYFSKLVLN